MYNIYIDLKSEVLVKKYSSSFELQNKILSGVQKLADNVSTTLGPMGRNVIIYNKGQAPIITKDGVTVARSVHLKDEFENLGAQIVKQASGRTNSQAGDGTTTSTVLTRAMLESGFAGIENNHSVTSIKKGMDHAKELVLDHIRNISSSMKSLDDIRHVAYISSNGDDEITGIISQAVTTIGKGGSITIEEARSNNTTLDLMEGFSFDSGYAAQAFVNEERLNVCRLENPIFLLTDEKLEFVDQILPALEIAAREGRPFVIVADDIEGQALAALIMNTMRGSMKVAAIKAPRYGEERRQLMNDLAITLGAKYYSQIAGTGLASSQITLDDFGSAKSITIRKSDTTIVGGQGDPQNISDRLTSVESEISQETSEASLRVLLERKARLVSGIAVIRVGAPTEVEMVEKKHRFEDALEAVRSAQEEGYIPGGGLSLWGIAKALPAPPSSEGKSFEYGFNTVLSALTAPLQLLCKNAQVDLEEVTSKVVFNTETGEYCGFDFKQGRHVDMLKAGIIDPAKVTRCALENAVSVAGTLLTTNAAIVEE